MERKNRNKLLLPIGLLVIGCAFFISHTMGGNDLINSITTGAGLSYILFCELVSAINYPGPTMKS